MAKETVRDTPFYDPTSIAWEAEGLFARDVNGQLVRFERAKELDYLKDITLTIDGEKVVVKKATPLTDSQGNIVNDQEGRTIPRFTTIYDAATKRYVKSIGDTNPIPILCHQEHMRPAAVCRVCSVEVYRVDRNGREARGQKLIPACQHPVEEGMIIHTLRSGDTAAAGRVRDSVRVLTELLAADHLRPNSQPSPSGRGQGEGDAAKSANPLTPTLSPGEREPAPNELAALVDRLHNNQIPCEPARFASKTPRERGHDFVSSDLININHDSCILCERCMRACDEVKQNFVICRSGKGYTAHIAFDLNNPMGESSCVSCGECMISCPTDALTFKPNRVVMSDWWKEKVDHGSGQEVDALALRNLHPLFSYIPYKFLQWNASAAVKVPVKAGQELCRQGDHGATAFILLGDCKFAILDEARRDVAPETPHQGVVGDILGRFFGGSKPVTSKSGDDKKAENFYRRAPEKDRQAYQQAIAASANGGEIDRKLQSLGELVAVRGSEDLILGEMSCMSYQRRTATIVALGDGEVLEIRRNVLYMLQRNPKAREMLDNAYRERALQVALRSLKAFTAPGAGGPGVASEQFERELYDFLKDKISLVRVDPGQVVFQQGETVTDFFVVRIGYVKVAQKYFGHEKVLTYLGPGRHFGEIGLLSNVDGLQAELGDERLPSEILGKRTATCTALDHVELVRIPGEAFNLIVQTYPHLREHYVSLVRRMLQEGREARVNLNSHLGEYLDQGLFNAQKLLVLDLERCTRCDECTKACADTHGGVTRLKREGLRFGKYLVASACRSCEDPYCLVGCPVDAIHRGEGNEIKIENHCIGCGLCEKNCPYGNIRMWPDPRHMLNPEDYNGERRAATTCDLCVSVIGANTKKDVSCVYSCPHEAAFRMSGAELYSRTAKSAD